MLRNTHEMELCLLCRSDAEVYLHLPEGQKLYFHCPRCDLRFLSASLYLKPEAEKEHYGLHNNDIHDPRYQQFVQPLVDLILEHSGPSARGLDYGCGSGPVASFLLQKEGRDMAFYDPLFYPNRATLEEKYNFILLSEVVEHFHDPHKEFTELKLRLKPGGFLAIMTSLWHPGIDFASWHYRRDPTHVCFYSSQTCQWIQQEVGYANVWTDEKKLWILSTKTKEAF